MQREIVDRLNELLNSKRAGVEVALGEFYDVTEVPFRELM